MKKENMSVYNWALLLVILCGVIATFDFVFEKPANAEFSSGAFGRGAAPIDTNQINAANRIYYLDSADGSPTPALITDNDGNIYVEKSTTGTLFVYMQNTGTTSVDRVQLLLKTEGASSGDPMATFVIEDTPTPLSQWTIGIDNSDSDKFKIANSNKTSTTTRMTLDGSGNFGINTSDPLTKFHMRSSQMVIGNSSYAWFLTKVNSQGAAWSDETSLPSLILHGKAGDRPEISFYRGSNTAPSFSIREHTTADKGVEIYSGDGSVAPTMTMAFNLGKVGIGISSPIPATLSVRDSTAALQLMLGNSAPYNCYLGVNSGNGFNIKNGGGFLLWGMSLASGNVVPGGNKTQDHGASGTAWDDIWADDFQNEPDIPFLDGINDLAVLCGIKSSGIIDKRTGLPIMDDKTFPKWMWTKAKRDQDYIEYKKDKNGLDTKIVVYEKHYKKGDIVYNRDGKPWISNRLMHGLSWGALRQVKGLLDNQQQQINKLKKEIELLKQKIN